MTTERWKKVEAVFERALEVPSEQRMGFVQMTCDGDEELRHEVESLLESHARAGSFIDQPSLFVANDESDERDAAVASGQLIGSYRVVRELGSGGMGTVYLAERADEQYRKRVAIKLVKRGMDTDVVLRRFRNERQILASFDHANIARLFDAGTTPTGLPYFVMEYVEGLSIYKYCDAHALSIPDRLKLFYEVCAGVAYAHRCGVIHRDIKCSNIIVTDGGVPKLVDFGIAKILQPAQGSETMLTTDLRPMTPQYASPEQVRGEALTVATDIYSLGVVLYELLTGQLPYRFISQSPHDITRAITEQEPTRPSTAVKGRESRSENRESVDSRFTKYDSRLLRGDLDNILLKALRKEPAQRYQSVEQLSQDIRHHLEGRAIIARPVRAPARVWRWSRRNPILAGAAGMCLLLALAVVWLLREQFTAAKTPAAEKSIAVLPFENLSRDPDNAFLTSGVQDEILTALSRISDLKVISRTSVSEYKSGIARDLREIGQQLGVAHVLEGTVQRSRNRVRVNAQLVDTRTDAHLWAQTYDRDIADIFSIQTEIAKAIANQLKAKLSASEQTAIAQAPTTDLSAFLLYTQAKSLIIFTSFDTALQPRFEEAIHLLNQAVARDPSFFLAYCQLAYTDDKLYFLGYDHTPARLALAEAAIQEAFRLRPNAGEAHLARAEHLYRGYLNYDGALVELNIARKTLPNDPRIFELSGFIEKHRLGKNEEAVRNFERALVLDPRNLYPLQQIVITYGVLRRYSEQTATVDRCLAIRPNDAASRVAKARIQLEWKADASPLHRVLESIRAENPAATVLFADNWFICALAERNASAAKEALDALGENTFGDDGMQFSRSFGEGLIARMTNDDVKAQAAFSAARAAQEKRVQEQPNYGPAVAVLGLIDAALGRKEEALREGRHALELLPIEKDSIDGMHMIENFAIIAAWVGESDLACEQLTTATRLPGYLSYGQLKLLPYWDPLRGDPRFDKIVASLAPKPADPVAAGSIATSSAGQAIVPDASVTPSTQKRVAVLPFKPLTQEDRDQVLEMGMADSLITKLSNSGGIIVPSVASIRKYGGLDQDPVAAGRDLKVDSVLEGDVQRSGDRVRVSARLIKIADGSSLWAGTFDEKFTDVFAVQDAISQKVADALALRLSGEQKNRLSKRYTENVEAYQLYLTGRYHWSRLTPTEIRKGIGLFQQAIDLDPNYALAYVGLAVADRSLAINADVPSKDCLPEAKTAALKAIELDDSLAEAHSSLSFALIWYDWDWAGGENEARRAINLDPNSAMAHFAYAHVLSDRGHHREAIAEIARARELEPVFLLFPALEGMFLHHAGRNDEALARLQKAVELDPNFWVSHLMLGKVYTQQRKYSQAIAELTKAKELSHGNSETIGSIGYVSALAGDKTRAMSVLEELKTRSVQSYVPPCNIALVYNGLGDQNEAIRFLQKAVDERDVRLTLLKVDPRWDSFRSNPQFIAILKRIGLQ